MKRLIGTRKLLQVPSTKKAQLFLPVLHGPMGEDGFRSRFLEVLKMPYVGCNICPRFSCYGQITTSRVLTAGIAQVLYVAIVEVLG